MSRMNALLWVIFSLGWFALIMSRAIADGFPDARTLWGAFGTLLVLAFALLPLLALAWWAPYDVTVNANGELEVRGLLRRRRVRPQQIKSIEWDAEGMCIRTERGKIRIPINDETERLAFFLAALNPAIKIDSEFVHIS